MKHRRLQRGIGNRGTSGWLEARAVGLAARAGKRLTKRSTGWEGSAEAHAASNKSELRQPPAVQAEASCSVTRSRSQSICAAKQDTAGMLHSSSALSSRAGSGGRSRPARGGGAAAAGAASGTGAGAAGRLGAEVATERRALRRCCSDSSTAVGTMNATKTWVHTISARQAPGAGMRKGGPPMTCSGLRGGSRGAAA